jgi:spore germination protein YaaH
MVRRNPARFLAPLALVAIIVGGYFIVHDNLTSKHTVPPHRVVVNVAPKGKYKHATFYTVQTGDNLTTVSQHTGVPVSRLEKLNPTINPNSLQTASRCGACCWPCRCSACAVCFWPWGPRVRPR